MCRFPCSNCSSSPRTISTHVSGGYFVTYDLLSCCYVGYIYVKGESYSNLKHTVHKWVLGNLKKNGYQNTFFIRGGENVCNLQKKQTYKKYYIVHSTNLVLHCLKMFHGRILQLIQKCGNDAHWLNNTAACR